MNQYEAGYMLQGYGINTPPLSLQGVHTWARVVSVYDADTMTVVLPVFGTVFKVNIRLQGIDCCEIKSKNKENKERAVRARNRVLQYIGVLPFDEASLDSAMTKAQIQNILSQTVFLVWLECGEMDKYGRVLANAYSSPGAEQTACFSERLINERFAYRYDGGTKLSEDQQASALA
jgi:endonuclease YncB( thermonuclease family)